MIGWQYIGEQTRRQLASFSFCTQQPEPNTERGIRAQTPELRKNIFALDAREWLIVVRCFTIGQICRTRWLTNFLNESVKFFTMPFVLNIRYLACGLRFHMVHGGTDAARRTMALHSLALLVGCHASQGRNRNGLAQRKSFSSPARS
jgi:hypothetical protein